MQQKLNFFFLIWRKSRKLDSPNIDFKFRISILGSVYLAKNLPKDVHPRGFNAKPPVKVAEVVEEFLQVLGVVDLAHDLLDHPQDVHAVPATQSATRKSFTAFSFQRPSVCPC